MEEGGLFKAQQEDKTLLTAASAVAAAASAVPRRGRSHFASSIKKRKGRKRTIFPQARGLGLTDALNIIFSSLSIQEASLSRSEFEQLKSILA